MDAGAYLQRLLAGRLDARAARWLADARAEVARGVAPARVCALLSTASRRVGKAPLAPTEAERAEAGRLLRGFDPERWTVLEAARVALLVADPALATEGGIALVEEAFRYADVGEACALYRALALLPAPERFRWRAGEGARSNMRALFEAACCDTPYPFLFFDEGAWNQALIKAIFVEAPLWRVYGLEERLSGELARMALDLADERRSAGRPVNPLLWLCLGAHGGARALASLEHELEHGHPHGRAAAALALVRAGEADRVRSLVAVEMDPEVREVMRSALSGRTDALAFRSLGLPAAATR